VTRILTIAGFAACGVLGAVLVLVSHTNPEAVTPFSKLLDRVMASRAARITILVFWWWVGWHFLVV
jgi:Family of unknown function (DUF6186)